MSSAWEDFENNSQLHTHKVIQEPKARKNDNPKIPCPYCGHAVSTTKTKGIMCYRCGKRFDQHENPMHNLTIQEIPSVLVKQAEIQLGRWCKCGCGNKIPLDARKDRLFFSASCRRNHLNKTKGYTESRFTFRARLGIKTPRMLFIYPTKGQKIKIPITKECKEIWKFCDEMESMK